MATIDISRAHKLALADAKQRAEQLAKDLEGKLGLSWRWDGDTIRFKGESGTAKGVSGAVIVTASQVRVEADLPFLLKAVKGSIAKQIEEKLDKALGPS